MSDHSSRTRKRDREEHEQLVAHEIHDGACQYAIAAKIAFERYRREKEETGTEDWNSFDAGKTFLDHVIEELRQLVRGLRPGCLPAADLSTSIGRLIEEVRNEGGPATVFRHGEIDAERIPLKLKHAAFRIVQESLANACRHSESKRLFVWLTLKGDSLHIRIRDWGVGFSPCGVPPGHFGLEGIRRRAKLLSGTATIRSVPGKGTCVDVVLPLVPSNSK